MNIGRQNQHMVQLVSRSFCPSIAPEGLEPGQIANIWEGQSRNTKGMEMSCTWSRKFVLILNYNYSIKSTNLSLWNVLRRNPIEDGAILGFSGQKSVPE